MNNLLIDSPIRETLDHLRSTFSEWSLSHSLASLKDVAYDDNAQNYLIAIRFHRFNLNYNISASTFQNGNCESQLRSAVTNLERHIARAFYQHNYDLVFSHTFEQRRILKQNSPGCRFCGRVAPEARFKNKAHAVPQSMGNSNLLTKYECDDCNTIFGNGIENHFGNFTLAERALFGVAGKSGMPKFQGKERDGHLHINGKITEIKISAFSGTVTTDLDPHLHPTAPPETITLTLEQPYFHPPSTLKAYYKMLLSVIPEEELELLDKNLFHWLRDSVHSNLYPGMFTCLVESLDRKSVV